MAFAILVAHKGDPWISRGKSFEMASLYLLIATTLIITGPGKFSVDAYAFGRKGR
jgi:uncharacterized membrane protein YphA (DoxX/SURF4 family)